MVKAILINGTDRVASRLTGVQEQIEKLLKQQSVEVETLFVHQLPAEDLIRANFASPAIVEAIQKVGEADIVVFLTPVFKGAYSGILKTFIDLLPQQGLQNKIALPVAIGGSIAHLLAIEYAINPVLSILGATTILSPIYIVDKQVERTENGFVLNEEVIERIEKVVNTIPFEQYA